jgi:hypothetical protein
MLNHPKAQPKEAERGEERNLFPSFLFDVIPAYLGE